MTEKPAKRSRAQRAAIAAVAASLLAAPAEGIRYTVYYDPPGIPTVCMGHTGPDVDLHKTYTDPECRALLTADMLKSVSRVDDCAPGAPQSVVIAFGDAVFNMGETIACNTKKSMAARLLKDGEYAAACRQLPRWNKAKVMGVYVVLPGLTKRREAEMNYCLEGLKNAA